MKNNKRHQEYYMEPPLKFDIALNKYVPDLPLRKKKVNFENMGFKLFLIILLIVVLIFFLFILPLMLPK